MKKLNYLFLLLTCLMLLGSCGKQMETVTVHSAEEFIKALKSDIHIIIDSDGFFDINQAVRNSELPIYDQDNPQKGVFKSEWDETFYICLDNIIIEGTPDKSRVHFLSYDETIDVLVFRNCNNVTIKHIMAGHNQSGECSGDVIWVNGSEDVNIDDCELYGCGVVGACVQESKNVTISNSWIYECSDFGITIGETENATVNNTLIEHCYNAFAVWDKCQNVSFSKCTINNNDEGGKTEIAVTFTDCDMQPLEKGFEKLATLNNCRELTPTEGYSDIIERRFRAMLEDYYDPEEDEEDSQEPEYITDCYTGGVDSEEIKGAYINEAEQETVVVYNTEELKNAIGSNKKIILESSEKISCKEDIELDGIINMSIEGRGEVITDYNFKITSGSSDIRIGAITFGSIHIGAGCNGIDIINCSTPDDGWAEYRLRIFDAENVLVNRCLLQNAGNLVLVNKSNDVNISRSKLSTSGHMVECHDVYNVWFDLCDFSNDTESDGKSLFVLDDPVVFQTCDFSVTEWKVDFSKMKCINCPKSSLITKEDLADMYE